MTAPPLPPCLRTRCFFCGAWANVECHVVRGERRGAKRGPHAARIVRHRERRAVADAWDAAARSARRRVAWGRT